MQPRVSGKPAEALFRAALDELQTPPDEALMIGDDIESDIGGAQGAGLRAVLVRTGKYRPADEHHARFTADGVADDLAQALAAFVFAPEGGSPSSCG